MYSTRVSRLGAVMAVLLAATGGLPSHAPDGATPAVKAAHSDTWTQEAILGFDYCGSPVSISGDTVVLGSADLARDRTCVFSRSSSVWNLEAELPAAGLVAISGDTVAVGQNDTFDSATLHVFQHHGLSWINQADLPVPLFVNSLALDGEVIVAGAPYGNNSRGLALVWHREGSMWSQKATLVHEGSRSYDGLGYAAATSGDTVVLGAAYAYDGPYTAEAAYVFRRSGSHWTQEARLSSVGRGLFGAAVAVSGDTVLVGSPYTNEFGNTSGSVYVFERSGTTWRQKAKLVPHDGREHQNFGASVDLSGDVAVVGAPRDSAQAEEAGAAYVFRREHATWQEVAKLTAQPPSAGSFMGRSVSVDGSTIVVGARAVAYVFFSSTPPSVSTGTVRGTVANYNERLMPGTTVKLAVPAGMLLASTVTNRQGEFQFSDVPAGEYSVSVDAPSYRPVSTDVTVDGSTVVLPMELNLDSMEQMLAARYAPALHVYRDASREDYRPQDVLLAVDNASLWRQSWPRRQTLVNSTVTVRDLAWRYAGRTDLYLDFPPTVPDPAAEYRTLYDQWILDNRFRSNMAYASITTDRLPKGPSGRQLYYTALQYWFFYLYNDWANQHEGDWESVTIVFVGDTYDIRAASGAPAFVAYSQHFELADVGGKEGELWSSGRVSKLDGRPVVYVADGSHASYFDVTDKWVGLGRDRAHANIGGVAHTKGVLIPGGNVNTPLDWGEHWINFLGRWGQLTYRTAGFDWHGPKSPSAQETYRDPFCWALDALSSDEMKSVFEGDAASIATNECREYRPQLRASAAKFANRGDLFANLHGDGVTELRLASSRIDVGRRRSALDAQRAASEARYFEFDRSRMVIVSAVDTVDSWELIVRADGPADSLTLGVPDTVRAGGEVIQYHDLPRGAPMAGRLLLDRPGNYVLELDLDGDGLADDRREPDSREPLRRRVGAAYFPLVIFLRGGT